jgi:hypothetical protein
LDVPPLAIDKRVVQRDIRRSWRGQSIIQSDFCRNQSVTFYSVEKPRKEHQNEKRKERAINRRGGFQEFLQKTPQGIGGAFHLSADGAGFAGAIVFGVRKDKNGTRPKRRKDTKRNRQYRNAPILHVHEPLSRLLSSSFRPGEAEDAPPRSLKICFSLHIRLRLHLHI